MRKTYIGWWVASAWLLCGCIRAGYEYIFFPNYEDSAGYPVLMIFIILTGVFFFIGYRRFKEYQEYQEDRKICNEYYQSNTQEEKLKKDQRIIHATPGMVVMTAEAKRQAEKLITEEREATKSVINDIKSNTYEAESSRTGTNNITDNEKNRKRERTVCREFSVAGVSRHQDVFERAGYRNDEYSLSKKRLDDEGLTDIEIPKYLFDTIHVSLELDPENEYDHNAVKVFLNNEHIGYIPQDDSEYVHDMMEDERITDLDARIVGGPYKLLNSDSGEIEKEDRYYGMRLDLYVKQDR